MNNIANKLQQPFFGSWNIFASLTNQVHQQPGYLLNTLVSQDSHSIGFNVLPGSQTYPGGVCFKPIEQK